MYTIPDARNSQGDGLGEESACHMDMGIQRPRPILTTGSYYGVFMEATAAFRSLLALLRRLLPLTAAITPITSLAVRVTPAHSVAPPPTLAPPAVQKIGLLDKSMRTMLHLNQAFNRPGRITLD